MSFKTITDLEERLITRLDPLTGSSMRPIRSDYAFSADGETKVLTPAAVLAPIVRRPDGWTMLLTTRTASMPTHAGQTAFPGGRVQPEDRDAVATALRETWEEIGLASEFIRCVGRTESYETGTGYEISPIVGLVDPGFELKLDPREVDAVFETPIEFLFDPVNHTKREGEFRGAKRSFYEFIHNDNRIWGATAGMIRVLYERLYE